MNPRLAQLQPYPFERLRKLFSTVSAPSGVRPVSLGLGEPQHPTPQLVKDALIESLGGLSRYPATGGEPALKEAIGSWIERRYGLPEFDAGRKVLPVLGSREALFSLTQTIVDASRERATVVCPNPFYQIYEGAAILAGAHTAFAPARRERNFACDLKAIPAEVWRDTQLLVLCSPGNPTGAVMTLDDWREAFALADAHGFVIASDECYSEIYFDEAAPPLGVLEAARRLGRDDRGLVMLSSLSKRSSVPGMRSGFVAGDPEIIARFLLYRTYHGSAMSPPVQHASIAAWGDEAHVRDNRALYRRKFDAVLPILEPILEVRRPDAAFYLWARVPGADDVFARDLYAATGVTVLPGSYMGRAVDGVNPGEGYVRMALVAGVEECVEAADRIAAFCKSR
ncbi:MAG: succinyldiaminopimelate transaminase [Burkholderiales bacterium]|nr:succinyldiaminopimelate transaminase [Burkholderiales bacterium]